MSETGMEINFRQSMEAAKALEKVADCLKVAVVEEFTGVLREIGKNWEGEAAELFFKKGVMLNLKLERSATALTEAARTVERSAKKIYLIEQQAAMLASLRWGR